MDTHAAIARRVSPDVIQFGNVINDGYLEYVGLVLQMYYDTPEKVEKLFSLGQLETLGAPGTEENSAIMDRKTGTFCTRIWHDYCPHEICRSEKDINPKVMFTDYYYFFDSDNIWYYVKPDLGMQKIPLVYALARMNYFRDNPESRPDILGKDSVDLCVRYEMEMAYLKEVLYEYPKEDLDFKEMLDSSGLNLEEVMAKLRKEDFPLHCFYEKNKSLIHYFDRWSVFDISKSSLPPVKVYLKKASEKHEETILWDVPIEPLN